MPSLYKILPFDIKHGNCGGSLVQYQAGEGTTNALPFEIGKVLVTSDIKTNDVRGLHAHFETEEIIVPLSGGCVFHLDDGKGKSETVSLKTGSSGAETDIQNALLLYPHVWRTFSDFDPDTVLLIIANIKYDEADYIRDRDEFERLAKTWSTLGGSS